MNGLPRCVMVTGAAGHLGRAVAAHFHQQGVRLLVLDRDAASLEHAFGDWRDCTALAVDLLDREAVKEAVASGLQRVQRIEAVCHLAGGFRMGERVHETSPVDWDFLMDLNARSMVHVAHAVVPHLLERGGRFVTVGAGAAQRGTAHMGAYCASKSAVLRLTEAMSAELRDRGVNVNCVLPSILDTPDNRAAMPQADPTRWVSPGALAEVIAFLVSDGARAVHGAAIPVSGLV